MVLKIVNKVDSKEVMTIKDDGVKTDLVKFHDGYYDNERLVIEICEGIITYLSDRYLIQILS